MELTALDYREEMEDEHFACLNELLGYLLHFFSLSAIKVSQAVLFTKADTIHISLVELCV